MDVPRLLHEYLKAVDQTQVVFAKRVKVAQGTVSKWIAGTQSPNKTQWDRVLAVIRRDPKGAALLSDVSRSTPKLVEVSLISWVSAGRLIDAESQVADSDAPKMWFSDLGNEDFFALKVQGDSMDRISPDGSIIVVDRSDRKTSLGKPYVFWHKSEGATYKLWQADPDRLEPHSWNAINKAIYIKRSTDFGVIGRVRRTVLDL